VADHNYVPRRSWDTGEAPYTIRQSGHFGGCAKCGGSPLAHGTGGRWPWAAIFGTLGTGIVLAVIIIRLIH
jgi:hypothetical protein